MVRLLVRQVLRFALGLFGAVLGAAGLSALAVEGAGASPMAYAAAFVSRFYAMVRLDFGQSLVSGWSAHGELAQALPYTATLAGLGAVVALAVGFPLGLLLGSGPARRILGPVTQAVSATPVFCSALILAWIATRLFHLPQAAPGTTLFAGSSGTLASTFVLPVVIVGLAGAATVQLALFRAANHARLQPWRAALRAMGLSALEIDRLYVMPEILAALCKNLGELALGLLSAVVVVEWVFGWPGAAEVFVKSLSLGDWNVAALILLVFAAIVITADFIGRCASALFVGEAP
jgi:peptide/nickel transport system permease protein